MVSEWFSHALHAVWMVVAAPYVYVVFRLRGPLLWNAVTVEKSKLARAEQYQASETQMEKGNEDEGPASSS